MELALVSELIRCPNSDCFNRLSIWKSHGNNQDYRLDIRALPNAYEQAGLERSGYMERELSCRRSLPEDLFLMLAHKSAAFSSALMLTPDSLKCKSNIP